AQIDQRMTDYIEQKFACDPAEARHIQKDYYVRFGTTLSGLMNEHKISPHDFMDFVHDIDLTPVSPNPALRGAIQALPGKRYIYTNGSVKHAENVAGKIGIIDLFDDIFDIEGADFVPKPKAEPYQAFLKRFAIDAGSAAMFEDMHQNLEVPHQVGMETVLVQSEAAWCEDEPADKRPSRPGENFSHVKHVTSDLTDFLRRLTRVA
ncbi:MAG: pyrimidine 5'-nucleotidase, partial [Pseudomonadota bacterium]